MVTLRPDIDLIERPLRIFRQFLVRRALYLVDQYPRGLVGTLGRSFFLAFADLVANAGAHGIGLGR